MARRQRGLRRSAGGGRPTGTTGRTPDCHQSAIRQRRSGVGGRGSGGRGSGVGGRGSGVGGRGSGVGGRGSGVGGRGSGVGGRGSGVGGRGSGVGGRWGRGSGVGGRGSGGRGSGVGGRGSGVGGRGRGSGVGGRGSGVGGRGSGVGGRQWVGRPRATAKELAPLRSAARPDAHPSSLARSRSRPVGGCAADTRARRCPRSGRRRSRTGAGGGTRAGRGRCTVSPARPRSGIDLRLARALLA